MIEKPPRFGSRRFGEILLPAFQGDPLTALAGLYWMATRRRVRGWSRLMIAASKAPLNYQRWTQHGERRAVAAFRRDHPRARGVPVLVLLLDENSPSAEVERTVQSIRDALGDRPIYSAAGKTKGLRSLPPGRDLYDALSDLHESHEGTWLLPIRAGDQVSPELGDILSRSLAFHHRPIVFWDEDRSEGGRRSDPWVKPDWDPLLFHRLGGLVGAAVFLLTAISDELRFPRRRVNPTDIAEFLFRLAEIGGTARIPLILTHRAHPPVALRLPPTAPAPVGQWPSVSIIIPTRDKPELLSACVKGIRAVDYPGKLQVVVVDNGSRDPAALELLRRIESDRRFVILRDHGNFNFSRLNNRAAAVADGELLCLLNNDVEPLHDDWLRTLVEYAVRRGVGAVGCQLVYPSGRIQHAGVAIGVGGAAGHIQKGVEPTAQEFRTWHGATREVSALTAAVLVLKKTDFNAVGGFDEGFAVAFNDVDLCLRLKREGLRNIFVAEVRLLHRESESRGEDRSPEKVRRFESEVRRLQERWATETYVDPHYSPLFSPLVERCVLVP